MVSSLYCTCNCPHCMYIVLCSHVKKYRELFWLIYIKVCQWTVFLGSSVLQHNSSFSSDNNAPVSVTTSSFSYLLLGDEATVSWSQCSAAFLQFLNTSSGFHFQKNTFTFFKWHKRALLLKLKFSILGKWSKLRKFPHFKIIIHVHTVLNLTQIFLQRSRFK